MKWFITTYYLEYMNRENCVHDDIVLTERIMRLSDQIVDISYLVHNSQTKRHQTYAMGSCLPNNQHVVPSIIVSYCSFYSNNVRFLWLPTRRSIKQSINEIDLALIKFRTLALAILHLASSKEGEHIHHETVHYLLVPCCCCLNKADCTFWLGLFFFGKFDSMLWSWLALASYSTFMCLCT